VLFHCSAGKDRTGVATALLLSALGVDRETIIQDYLASAENVAEKYYPVGPFIEKTVKDMRDLAVLLTQDDSFTVSFVNEKLEETVKPKVAESVMNGASSNWETVPRPQKLTIAQNIVDQFLASDQASATINYAVNQYKNSLMPLSNPNFDINGYAAGARAKVQPLLTVRREYIEAAFQVIDSFGSVDLYLTNGLGLNSTQILNLKNLYLE
jgi:hypothetical protein